MKKFNEVNRAYNFSSGPTQLPFEVLAELREELLNYKNTGMSIMEMSHRSEEYSSIHNETQILLRELLEVPDDYEIAFIQGGARLQFSMIPLNFCNDKKSRAGYILTDVWSEEALNEAKFVCDAYDLHKSFTKIPDFNEIMVTPDTAYIHITSNNTIMGTQYKVFPNIKGVPLVADMTSDILSKKIDISKFDLIYAAAQKNLGVSGVTVIIIKKDFLKKASNLLPDSLSYNGYITNNSMLSTPPTLNIYIMNLVLKWIKNQGGVSTIEKRNNEKANLIYTVIDESNGFYEGLAETESRSRMNITFKLLNKDLEEKLLTEATSRNIIGINGHFLRGGIRISTYNGVEYQDCVRISELMKEFQIKYSFN